MSETMATCMDLAAGLGRGAFFTNVERPRRVAVAVVAAFVVAEAAVLLLRPRDGVIAPVPVDPRSYFTRRRDRARSRLSATASSRSSPPARRSRLGAARAGSCAAHRRACAGRSGGRCSWRRAPARRCRSGFAVAQLPVGGDRHQRAVDVGLSTQSWGAVAGRRRPSRPAIGAVFAGGGAAVALALMRRFPRGWWVPGSVAGGRASPRPASTSGPVVLDPIFNEFTPLPEGRTRADVLALAREAGVEVGQVYEVDASRRTTAANAYVTGLGPHQARRPLRHPAQGLHAATRCASWSPTSSATCTTATCRAACSTSRWWRRRALFAASLLTRAARARRAAARAGGAAGAGALGRAS